MMQDATLCFLLRGNPPREVLLGFKKTGFGSDKYNGFGGKVEPGETIAAAAARELSEEAGVAVDPAKLRRVAHLTFLFPVKTEFNQVVHVFVAQAWQGDPAESREMRPAWFNVDEIPFDRMWDDDAYWLPLVLRGKKVRATFWYRDDNERVDTAEILDWDGDERGHHV